MLQTSVEIVNPGGTGRPALVISARPEPLPPSRSFMFRLPSAFPPPKKYTCFRDLGFGVRDLPAGRFALAFFAIQRSGIKSFVVGKRITRSADLPPSLKLRRDHRSVGEGGQACLGSSGAISEMSAIFRIVRRSAVNSASRADLTAGSSAITSTSTKKRST